MGTITTFVDNVQAMEREGNLKHVVARKIDFSVTPVDAADVVQVLKIPKGALVTNVAVIVKTAEGATCTVTVGDAAGANSWDASVDLNAAAGTATYSAAGTDAYAYGKYYAAADTIDFTMGHDTDAAIVVVTAEYQLLHNLP